MSPWTWERITTPTRTSTSVPTPSGTPSDGGESGVLIAQPYKGELLPHWRFATPEVARESAETIYGMYLEYKAAGDFVGQDMARKYLQMGYTRAKRYANHKGGRKYDGPVPDDKKGQSGAHGRAELPRDIEDPVKAESARLFKEYWDRVREDPEYQDAKERHKQLHAAWKREQG